MTYRDAISDAYFEWMFDMVCHRRFAKGISYRKLLVFLHDTDFRYSIQRDFNRAEDGIDLRYKFDHEAIDYLSDKPCSVLEMMIALSIRCEEFMDDPCKGDRTGQWFWGMITNLGLGSMTDDNFDREYVRDVVERFLDRDYKPDGKGGLFTVRNCDRDLRDVEIWYQLCWYLDNIC